MSDELRRTLAYVFKARGREDLPRAELKHALSLGHQWFSPSEAGALIAKAIGRGELVETGDHVRPTFAVASVKLEPSFRPTRAVLAESEAGVLDEAVERVASATKKPAGDILREVNALQESLGNRVSAESAALLIARGHDLDVADLAARALAGRR